MIHLEKKYRKKISLDQQGNSLLTLVAINLIVFILLAFIKVLWVFRYNDQAQALSLFNKDVLKWFTLPASFDRIMSKPWTLLTHMFVQVNIWQIFPNMIWLWCFGYILRSLTGNRKIIPLFIYGSLAGAAAFILVYNFLPSLNGQLPVANYWGASAGVMAIAISTTLISPGYRLFPMLNGGIPLLLLTTLYVIVDLATISFKDPATLSAHLAGALIGYSYIFFLRRGYDWCEWMSNLFDWIGNLFNPDRPGRKTDIKQELFYRSRIEPYTKTPNITQQRIDEILDKINQQGYGALTDEEKELLRKASKDL